MKTSTCKNKKKLENIKKLRKTKKNSILKGGFGLVGSGKTTSDGNVKLQYNNNNAITDVKCQNCSSNNYDEVIGTLNKSKARAALGDFFFGNDVQNIDNTSIISYFCNTCGLCKMIRNKDIKIFAIKI